jgi:hypothetical protein
VAAPVVASWSVLIAAAVLVAAEIGVVPTVRGEEQGGPDDDERESKDAHGLCLGHAGELQSRR